MDTREYRTLDKTAWGVGPWQDEPDKRQWQDERTGLPCLIVRSQASGSLCGYVGVPSAHPAHGKDYNFWGDDDETFKSPVAVAISNLEVHGGLTFADSCSYSADESRGICHAPGAGEPDDVWWFGFDTAHSGDKMPAISARIPELYSSDDRYRTVEYVAGQCTGLAQQLAAIAVLDEVRQATEVAVADRA